jgi:nitronate monooxygenase
MNLLGLPTPIWLAPMAGACPPSLSIAVMQGGGLGACGAVAMKPPEILAWADEVRPHGLFQINLWIPGPDPVRDAAHEQRVRDFLAGFGPVVKPDAGDAVLQDFDAQCEAVIAAKPAIASSIMGVFPPAFVARLKAAGIQWLANATTVGEALAAEAAGADLIVAQGMEAGGHRGSFDAATAERDQVGLFALLPAIVDAVRVPVIAAGAICDARTIAAALALGARAVSIGTGFLRCPEADAAWVSLFDDARPEDTMLTRAFSGRAGRSLANRYVRAAGPVAPYPVQRGLTAAMRAEAVRERDPQRMQAWAGQAASRAPREPAAALVERWWREAQLR